MRIKTFFVGLGILFLFCILPSYAFSQTLSPTETFTPPSTKTRPLDTLKDKKQQTQDLRMQRKEEMQAEREEFVKKREEYKEKLKILRDEKKKAVVERIDTKMKTVNTNHTTRMSETISKLRSVLSRIKQKRDIAQTNGNDTTLLNTAIANAETALDVAQNGVTTQATKEYVITVESESTLKTTVGSTTKQLESDLHATYTLVVDAKKTVMTAATELSKLKPRKNTNASPSGETQK